MIMKNLAISALALLMSNVAFAQTQTLARLPMEDGGMLALAAACLAIGIRIVRRK